MTQGRASESREGGRAESPARQGESGRAQRDEPGMRDSGRAESRPRDAGKQQRESSKEQNQRDTGKDRAQQDQKDQKGQKGQTVGQGRSDRGDARRSDDRAQDKGHDDKGKADAQRAQQPADQKQSGSSAQGQSAQDRNQTSGATQGQTGAPAQGQSTTAGQTQTTTAGQTQASRTNLTTQQQTTLQQSVLHASNAPRVNVNSINFQVHTGVVLPSHVSIVSVSTFPALIDVFPVYRDYSFFVVEDEIVFVDRDRRIVDVVPAGPRTRFSARGGGGSVAAVDLAPDDIRVVQRVLIERGLLTGEADGIWGPQTREALVTFQRQQGIEVSGTIDTRTVTSLGVSNRLSAQASQSLNLTQSATTGQQGQTGQQPSQQNATGQSPAQGSGQANAPSQQNQPGTTTGQAPSAQGNTPGQAAPQPQGSNTSPQANQDKSSGQTPSTGSGTNQPAQSNAPSK